MKKAEYKNARENKRKITSCFLKLIIEKKKFTVIDLVKEAGINRGTFYLHFKNLKEVYDYIEDEVVKNFKGIEEDFRMCEIDKNPELILTKLNSILEKDLEFYKMIITAIEPNNLMEEIRSSILKIISNNFKVMQYVTDYDSFNIVVHYVTGGVIAVYNAWFNGEIKLSLDEVASYCGNIIKSGLKGCIDYR